jgi:thymidylate kinase
MLIFVLLTYVLATHFLVVKPLLNRFTLVCDRYYFDWFYRAFGRSSLSFTYLLPRPDVVFFLYLPVEMARSRMSYSPDRELPLGYYRAMQEWYRRLAVQRGFIEIDSSRDFTTTSDAILCNMTSLMGDKLIC